jgi:4,5-dihydroxyphthalate decarboxylase
MSRVKLTLVTRPYDYVAPLACADVVPEGVDLTLIRDRGAIDRVQNDRSIDGGEVSLSRSLMGVAQGDRSWTLLPIFVYRGFQHRHFYIRRESPFHGLEDFRGKRIGIEHWPTTGSTWCRAAIRERGVDINEINWFVGPLRGQPSTRPQGKLPPFAQFIDAGRTLEEMLLGDELDALNVWQRPSVFDAAQGPIVRLFADYRTAERDYFQRTQVVPGLHIIRVREQSIDGHRWVLRSLYEAFEGSKSLSQSYHRDFAETTPWLLAELEETMALLGPDWWPNGVAPNERMIQAFCDEQLQQGMISSAIDTSSIFADFEAAMA